MALFTAIGTALGATAATAMATGVGATALTAAAVGGGMLAANAMSSASKSAKDVREGAQMPTAPKTPVKADASKLAQQQATDKRRAAARSTSVKTNPLGIKDQAEVARKKLLGS